MSQGPSPLLVSLTEQRWALAVLSALADRRGAKFVTLERTLGAPKESLARALAGLLEAGLVERPAGYGHPLRPEYVLTEAGAHAAQLAGAVQAALVGLELRPGRLGRWALPALAAMHAAPIRFNALARTLAPVTPRALSASLSGLVEHDLAARRIAQEGPLQALYAVGPRGHDLAAAVAQWG